MKKLAVSRMRVWGFKSLKECDLALGNLNVLIGPNGAGKSNFLQVFTLMQRMATGRLIIFTGKCGGPDALLWFGRKQTKQLDLAVTFDDGRRYACTLEPTQDNRFLYTNECVQIGEENHVFWDTGYLESGFFIYPRKIDRFEEVFAAMKTWHPVHLNDTGTTASIKQCQHINDNLYLRSDGSNLASILYFLQYDYPQHYNRLVRTIRLAAPFFQDFILRPCRNNRDQIELEWTETGDDVPLKAHLLSDGTLRFMCLATLLLLPDEMQSATILIDEPELGLHPYALKLLAGILRSVSHRRQIIVSTQSATLVDEFAPENIIVADRTQDGTHLHRLDAHSLADWLKEYSLGELWQKNLLGGRP